MTYIIQRIDQGGGYLGHAPGQTGQTWVRDIAKAARFVTLEAAQRECCENETPVELDSIFHGKVIQ